MKVFFDPIGSIKINSVIYIKTLMLPLRLKIDKSRNQDQLQRYVLSSPCTHTCKRIQGQNLMECLNDFQRITCVTPKNLLITFEKERKANLICKYPEPSRSCRKKRWDKKWIWIEVKWPKFNVSFAGAKVVNYSQFCKNI